MIAMTLLGKVVLVSSWYICSNTDRIMWYITTCCLVFTTGESSSLRVCVLVCVCIHNLSVSSWICHDTYLEVRQPCLTQFLCSLLHRQALLSPPLFSLEESWNYRHVFSCLTLHWFWRSEFSTSHLQDFTHKTIYYYYQINLITQKLENTISVLKTYLNLFNCWIYHISWLPHQEKIIH